MLPPLKDKKGDVITNAFQKALNESNRKPKKKKKKKKKWVEKGREFYNRKLKSWLQKNTTEMYSTYS